MPVFSSALYRFPDNAAVTASMLEMELTYSLSSPAASLTASFICPNAPGEISEAHIYLDGNIIFTGKVDKQRMLFNTKGTVLRLECRSSGALLLDNEARPGSYFNVGTHTIFSRHIAPYGFTLKNPGADVRLPAYTVGKGTSEWEAFCDFTQRAYGITPYVKGREVILAPPESSASGLSISNSGAGNSFDGVEYSFTPYNIISKIYLRDAFGSYSSVVENPVAAYYGIERKRYMIPPNEFVEGGGADAISRVKSSMLAREEITVSLPGAIEAELGQKAGLDAGILEKYGFMVGEITYKSGKAGYFTELKLLRTE